jgi:hypothetical protein
MKKYFVRLALATLFLVAIGPSPALADGGGPTPLCTPDQHCALLVDGTGPTPLCTPDQHCTLR